MTRNPICFAGIDKLREIKDTRTAQCFVWPDEGEFLAGGWEFNDQHQDFDPLWVDPTTASAMLAVRAALREDQHPKFDERLARDRGSFAVLVEFTWKHVKA